MLSLGQIVGIDLETATGNSRLEEGGRHRESNRQFIQWEKWQQKGRAGRPWGILKEEWLGQDEGEPVRGVSMCKGPEAE